MQAASRVVCSFHGDVRIRRGASGWVVVFRAVIARVELYIVVKYISFYMNFRHTQMSYLYA